MAENSRIVMLIDTGLDFHSRVASTASYRFFDITQDRKCRIYRISIGGAIVDLLLLRAPLMRINGGTGGRRHATTIQTSQILRCNIREGRRACSNTNLDFLIFPSWDCAAHVHEADTLGVSLTSGYSEV